MTLKDEWLDINGMFYNLRKGKDMKKGLEKISRLGKTVGFFTGILAGSYFRSEINDLINQNNSLFFNYVIEFSSAYLGAYSLSYLGDKIGYNLGIKKIKRDLGDNYVSFDELEK